MNRKGFTLLEVIIVVVILGILASVALPRLIRTTEYSKAAEALVQFGTIRGAMNRCYMMNSLDYTTCDFATLDIEDPTATSQIFNYAINNQDSTSFVIVATSLVSGDIIQIDQDGVKSGTGDFIGI
jgi:prepilin-type N-terminal cleavage/methylation domain-containing protein